MRCIISPNQSLSICGGGDISPRNGLTIESHGFRFVLANLADLWPAPFHDRPKLRQKIDYPRAHFFGSFLQQAIKMPARGSSRACYSDLKRFIQLLFEAMQTSFSFSLFNDSQMMSHDDHLNFTTYRRLTNIFTYLSCLR